MVWVSGDVGRMVQQAFMPEIANVEQTLGGGEWTSLKCPKAIQPPLKLER